MNLSVTKLVTIFLGVSGGPLLAQEGGAVPPGKVLSMDEEGQVRTQIVPADRLPKSVPGVAVPWRTGAFDDLECGVKALYMFLKLTGADVTLKDIQKELPVGDKGVSMLRLKQVAQRHGVDAEVIRCSRSGFEDVGFPFVARLAPDSAGEIGHYVVVTGVANDLVFCADGSTGRVAQLKLSRFTRLFSGYALAQPRSGRWAPLISFVLIILVCMELGAIARVWWRRRAGKAWGVGQNPLSTGRRCI